MRSAEFGALLAARADQLHVDLVSRGEALEQLAQIQLLEGVDLLAGELVAGFDIAVLVLVLVLVSVGMLMLVFISIIVVVIVATEQRAFQFLLGHLAGASGQAEQLDGFLQFGFGSGDLGLVRIALGGMLEADEVHRRAVDLQFQVLTVEGYVEAGHAMLVRAEAAVFMVVVVMGLDDSQGQQGEGEGEQ
ncbi:hypothetical protein PSEUDO8Z_170303 [Pseudomonas sp. 8Z]|nr:hypothetical protein PSEUDO8Z_170303 [Pseudomonas sp. 8Z]